MSSMLRPKRALVFEISGFIKDPLKFRAPNRSKAPFEIQSSTKSKSLASVLTNQFATRTTPICHVGANSWLGQPIHAPFSTQQQHRSNSSIVSPFHLPAMQKYRWSLRNTPLRTEDKSCEKPLVFHVKHRKSADKTKDRAKTEIGRRYRAIPARYLTLIDCTSNEIWRDYSLIPIAFFADLELLRSESAMY